MEGRSLLFKIEATEFCNAADRSWTSQGKKTFKKRPPHSLLVISSFKFDFSDFAIKKPTRYV